MDPTERAKRAKAAAAQAAAALADAYGFLLVYAGPRLEEGSARTIACSGTADPAVLTAGILAAINHWVTDGLIPPDRVRDLLAQCSLTCTRAPWTTHS